MKGFNPGMFVLDTSTIKIFQIALRSCSLQRYAGIELNSMATGFYAFFLIFSGQVLLLSPLLGMIKMAY